MKCACAILSPVASRLYSIFPRYLINEKIKKKFITHKRCSDFLYSFRLEHFSFYEDCNVIRSKTCIGLHVKYPLFLSDFIETCFFLNRFSKNIRISNFMKICPVRAQFFHTDRRTDMTKLTDAFRNFAKAPKMSCPYQELNQVPRLCIR